MYPVREERGAELVRFHTSVHEQYLWRGVPGEEIMRKRRAIDEEHVRGNVGRTSPVHYHVIISVRNEELVYGFRYQLVAEMNSYMHLPPLSTGTLLLRQNCPV